MKPAAVAQLPVWSALLSKNPFDAALPFSTPRLRTACLSIVAFTFDVCESSALSEKLVADMLSEEMLLSPNGVQNLELLLYKCSLQETYAGYLVRGVKVFSRLLKKLSVAKTLVSNADRALQNAVTAYGPTAAHHSELQRAESRRTECAEYCSKILRNVCLHLSLIGDIVLADDLGTLLHEIVDLKLESTYFDAACALYFCARDGQMKEEGSLSPTSVLQIITKLMACCCKDDDSATEFFNRLVKHIVGLVLDKYSMGAGVHPSFVESMYAEMHDRTAADFPKKMGAVEFTVIEGIPVFVPVSFFSTAVAPTFPPFQHMETQWNHIIVTLKKQMSNDFYNRTKAEPAFTAAVENVDVPESPEYAKVIKLYACVKLD